MDQDQQGDDLNQNAIYGVDLSILNTYFKFLSNNNFSRAWCAGKDTVVKEKKSSILYKSINLFYVPTVINPFSQTNAIK